MTDQPRSKTEVIRLAVALAVLVVLVVGGAVTIATNRGHGAGNYGADENVTTLGSAEVTGRLLEIPGEFLSNRDGLYNYAFVLKYEVLQVHRGQVGSSRIAVAHYNPLKPRPEVADQFYEVAGKLKRFRAGDVHRMALEVPLDDYYMGGIVDRYFEEEKGPIYWAVWTNPVD